MLNAGDEDKESFSARAGNGGGHLARREGGGAASAAITINVQT